MRTQVGIVGAGPAGLTLGLLLERAGIECVILEDRSREHVERRARAGLLEQNTVDLFRDLGASERLDREALEHNGINLRVHGETTYIAITELTGRHVTIYGQHEVLKDLIACALDRGLPLQLRGRQHRRARARLAPTPDHVHRRVGDRLSSSSATSSPAATASTGSAGPRSRVAS